MGKMICSEPNFHSCNYTTTKQCLYHTVCELITYNQVAHPLYCACPEWYDDDKEFSEFIKQVFKSYPDCPYCGKALEKRRPFTRCGFDTPHDLSSGGVKIFGMGRIGNVKGSGVR